VAFRSAGSDPEVELPKQYQSVDMRAQVEGVPQVECWHEKQFLVRASRILGPKR
jgi:hypothetical protein